jgi:hypothetical protein
MTNNPSTLVPHRGITPAKLPLSEQAALLGRLQSARQRPLLKSWRQLAVEEGFAERTLEHFYMRAIELELNADKRPDWVVLEERARRFIRARDTAMPPNRIRYPLTEVPDDFVFPPPRRDITPSQLPLREQAALFAELQEARRQEPSPSWRYLEVLHGFARRTLEHFHRSAIKLGANADNRSLAEMFGDRIRARSSGAPVGRRSRSGLGEVRGDLGRAADRKRARTEAQRRARQARTAEAHRPEALRDQHAAEARHVEWQQGHAQELLSRAEETLREAAEERGWGPNDEQLRSSLQSLMQVWDPFWGPRPLDPSEVQ